jgi:hypothetical protein
MFLVQDWDENEEMDDPTDKKPDGWDEIPKQIVDPDASKPEDWDDDSDGEWEAPTIDNPAYKVLCHQRAFVSFSCRCMRLRSVRQCCEPDVFLSMISVTEHVL